MKELSIIETELGEIPIITAKNIKDGEIQYEGTVIYDDMTIIIQTPTKELCLVGLKNTFEIQMHFWLYKELLPINIALRND